jgi:hypothetical protein
MPPRHQRSGSNYRWKQPFPGERRCGDCEGRADRPGAYCSICRRARENLPTALQRTRKALLWRVRKNTSTLSPSQVNYVMREHWDRLDSESRRRLENDLRHKRGRTQSHYEALLDFGLRELRDMGRLSNLPSNLHELRLIVDEPVSPQELAELDRLETKNEVAEAIPPLTAHPSPFESGVDRVSASPQIKHSRRETLRRFTRRIQLTLRKWVQCRLG